MNYGELKTLIADYSFRSDMASRIVTFIQLAQARMSRDLDLVEMEKSGTITTAAGVKTADVPADLVKFLDIQAPSNGGYITLEQDSFMGIGVRNGGGETGIPQYFARYADKIIFAPIPSGILSLPILYSARIANFSADADTDDILTNWPNIYIYATMLEMLPFLSDKNTTWRDMYLVEVAALNARAEDTRWSGGPLVMNTNRGVTIR